MACYDPIPAYQPGPGLKVILWPPTGYDTLQLPCGKCLGCLSNRATEWGHRCSHEASLWPSNLFLTVTYDDDHLPKGGELVPRDLQLLVKRLRERATRDPAMRVGPGVATPGDGVLGGKQGPIRYLAGGEYGTDNGRPHYHLLLFNLGFTETEKVGKDAYQAEILRELWPQGRHEFGDLTPGKAANYIAQYNLKKQEWDKTKVAPFLRMSRRPAIGIDWLRQYQTDLRHGYLVENARLYSIPRSYKRFLKKQNAQLLEEITLRSQEHQNQNQGNQDPERLQAAEKIHKRYKELTESRTL